MSQARKMRVAVVIDSFNAGELVGAAIESVLRQTRPADEIIISDASTDGSRKVIEELAAREDRITAVFGENRGQLATILAGLEKATGDLVFLLDGDDRYKPTHLESMISWWNKFPQADLLYCRHKVFGDQALADFVINRENHENAAWLGSIDLRKPYDWGSSSALAWCHPDYHAGGITSALSFRLSHVRSLPLRALCEETGGTLRANADYMMLLASALYGGRKVFVPEQTVEHRLHARSVTGRHASGDRDSLAAQRRYCAAARSWLCSRPGFGPELFTALDSELRAVPEPTTGHRRLYQEAKAFDSNTKSLIRRLQASRREVAQLREKLEAVESSTIWRTTAPVRYFLDKVRAARRRLFRQASVPLTFQKGVVAVDISTIWHRDAGTGIQRVVRRLATELAAEPRGGKRVVLVDYSTGVPLDITKPFLSGDTNAAGAERIAGMEMLVMLDSSYNLAPSFSRRLREARERGVFVVSICHDLLPVSHPEWFLAVNHIPFRRWLALASEYSSAFLCVSDTTASHLREYMGKRMAQSSPLIASWPLGHDLEDAPGCSRETREHFALMVGTVEPRKNHAFVARALADMRAAGKNPLHLVVVGRYGWKNKSAARLLCQGRREGWITWRDQGASDEELAELYARSTCVIQASLDEGFGLPVAEAAAFGKPVVLSDIPVFREIVRENGYFFRLGDTGSFARAFDAACRPGVKPTKTKAVSWRDSADLFWQTCLELQATDRARRSGNLPGVMS